MSHSPIGECKLCGKTTNLTFEHVPPQKAFNFMTLKKFQGEEALKLMTGEDDRLPWDSSRLCGKLVQGGVGDYYLCTDCNNSTGSWYMSDYVELTKTLNQLIISGNLSTGNASHFTLKEIRPLRILKAIMTMFCDINTNCFGDEQLRNFLLNKESQDLNLNKYSIYIYLVNSNMPRISSLTAMYDNIYGIKTLSEIAFYPLGFTLYINKPTSFDPPGLPITSFVEYSFNDICDIECVDMPYYEINSTFPADFRTKYEIEEDI